MRRGAAALVTPVAAGLATTLPPETPNRVQRAAYALTWVAGAAFLQAVSSTCTRPYGD